MGGMDIQQQGMGGSYTVGGGGMGMVHGMGVSIVAYDAT